MQDSFFISSLARTTARGGFFTSSLARTACLACCLVLVLTLSGPCEAPAAQPQAAAFKLTSPALRDGDKLARQFACDGGDRSLPLAFSGTPHTAKSLAVLMTEADVPKGNATLWIVYNLPPSTTNLPENQPHTRALKSEGLQLPASNGKMGYAGPCPPGGLTRRFVIEAFALDTLLDLPDQTTRRDFLLAVEGHILARAKLNGKYKK